MKNENGEWRMENGGWRMEDGGWRMEDGGWRIGIGMWNEKEKQETGNWESRIRPVGLGFNQWIVNIDVRWG